MTNYCYLSHFVAFYCSKTLVCAGSTTSVRRSLDPCDSKENIPNTTRTETDASSGVAPVFEKRDGKLKVNPAKKARATATVSKSKVMKLEKGQRQLSSFFRV